MRRRLFILLHTLCGGYLLCMAQNNTNLPTSMYGIGELSTADGGRYAGMGQAGIALNRIGFLNTQNPAAITRMDTACFTFDVGVAASYARYHFLSESSSNMTGNPNRISLGLRVMPRWYAMIGVAPYSSVGYLIRTTETIEGDPNSYLYSTFEGSGGLYKLYATNAVQLTPRLSVGANIGMVLGKVTQSETQEGAEVERSSTKRALYVDFGLHYSWGKRWGRQWEVGAVFAPSIGIHQNNDLAYGNSSTSETVDEDYHTAAQYLPTRIGLGIATSTERWTLTADYNYVDWSRNKSTSITDYDNQHKGNIGVLYRTNPRVPRPVELMGGVGVSNSYICLKNGKMLYIDINAGISIPIGYSFLSIGAGWRRQLNSRAGLMQESRWSLNLNLTFGEKLWRSKLK